MSASAEPGRSAGMLVRSAGAVRCASSGATAAFSMSVALSTVSVRRSRPSASSSASRRPAPSPPPEHASSGGSTNSVGTSARSRMVRRHDAAARIAAGELLRHLGGHRGRHLGVPVPDHDLDVGGAGHPAHVDLVPEVRRRPDVLELQADGVEQRSGLRERRQVGACLVQGLRRGRRGGLLRRLHVGRRFVGLGRQPQPNSHYSPTQEQDCQRSAGAVATALHRGRARPSSPHTSSAAGPVPPGPTAVRGTQYPRRRPKVS